MADDYEKNIFKHKMKPKDLWITHEVSKTIKDVEKEWEIDFESIWFEVLKKEKIDGK